MMQKNHGLIATLFFFKKNWGKSPKMTGKPQKRQENDRKLTKNQKKLPQTEKKMYIKSVAIKPSFNCITLAPCEPDDIGLR